MRAGATGRDRAGGISIRLSVRRFVEGIDAQEHGARAMVRGRFRRSEEGMRSTRMGGAAAAAIRRRVA